MAIKVKYTKGGEDDHVVFLNHSDTIDINELTVSIDQKIDNWKIQIEPVKYYKSE